MVQLRARNDVVQRGVKGREDGGLIARSKKERKIRKRVDGWGRDKKTREWQWCTAGRTQEREEKSARSVDDCDDIQCMEGKKRNERCVSVI